MKPLEIETPKTDAAKVDASQKTTAVCNSKPVAIVVAVALAFQVFVEGVGLGGETEMDSGY